MSRPFSASQRVLVVLLENGGVDLGVGRLLDAILEQVPGSSLIPQATKDALVRRVTEGIKQATDNLLENAELTLNRYQQARPDYYGNVIVLRNGSAFYRDLRDTLIRESAEGKVIDLFVLTHGGTNSLAAGDAISGEQIREIRTVHNQNRPVHLRSVYMMNCVGSSLNQAWLDIGAKASCGSIRNNYLPEPTMFFFFRNWKAGQSFNDSVINAYQGTIAAINGIIRSAADAVVPSGIAGKLVEYLADIESRSFVRDSAPVVAGDGSITLGADALSFTNTLSSVAFAILPLSTTRRRLGRALDVIPRTVTLEASAQLVTFVKSFEGFRGNLYNDPVGHCTIGYGTLVHQGNCDGRAAEAPYAGGVSEERATELLRERLRTFERTVNDSVQTELSQHQFDALVSFCYNVGAGAFRDSTLLRRLNAGDYGAVPDELARWTRAGGRVLPGLVRRRAAEARMFTSGDYSAAQSLSGAQQQARGIRNNNPGNIRISNEDWEGKVPRSQNTDGAFEQFTSFVYGVRALLLLLRNYITRGNPPRNTVRRIVSAYAPASDNNHTENYISFTLNRLRDGGLDVRDDTPLVANAQTLRLLAQAIGRMENGVDCITDAQFQEAYDLLPANGGQSAIQSRAFSGDSAGRARAIAEAALETEGGERDESQLALQQQTGSVAAHCPINAAEDASTIHFSLAEFRSHDGGDVPSSLRGNIQLLMNQLEVLRQELGQPITIISGYRSPAHNGSVGGADRSQHLCGRAADISVAEHTPEQVHAKIEELIAAGRMMQGGLGRYATFVHYDTRGVRARWTG